MLKAFVFVFLNFISFFSFADTLAINQQLQLGQSLRSNNGQYNLIFQTDGNLVLYDTVGNVKFTSNSHNRGGVICSMQADGNLVIYDASSNPVWASNTAGKYAKFLDVGDDVVLRIFQWNEVWATGTWVREYEHVNHVVIYPDTGLAPNTHVSLTNNAFTLVMQGDGNLVLYRNGDGAAVWATYTQGNPGAFMRMQGDGNLVVYSADWRPLWATYTQNKPGAFLFLQPDGNLVIRHPGLVWQNGNSVSSGGGAWSPPAGCNMTVFGCAPSTGYPIFTW